MFISNNINDVFYRSIASFMGAAVNDILWAERSLWLQRDTGKVITTKVGSGQATYFKPHRDADTIVFGKKMVASKCTVFAGQWLSYRELIQFDFFDGSASPINLLAHTACHEFAHYLQAHFKQRRKGEVHNQDFYRYLSEIYSHGLAGQVKQFLIEADSRLVALPVIEPVESHLGLQPIPKLHVGDTVYFSYNGERIGAKVMRVNRKTVSAKALVGSGIRQAYWRIPFRLIQPDTVR